MKKINRRDFFKVVGSVLAGTVVTILPIGAESKKIARDKLKHFNVGDALSVTPMNDMVDAINDLYEN